MISSFAAAPSSMAPACRAIGPMSASAMGGSQTGGASTAFEERQLNLASRLSHREFIIDAFNEVNVLGVDLATWSRLAPLRPLPAPPVNLPSDLKAMLETIADQKLARAGLTREARDRWAAGETVLLNEALAKQLRVAEGDEIILRIRKPTQLAQDAVISPKDDSSLALRLKVGPSFSPELLGDFSLAANQAAVNNAFLPSDFLARKIELAGRANLLLKGSIQTWDDPTWWDTRKARLLEWVSNRWPFSLINRQERRPPGFAAISMLRTSSLQASEALPVLATHLDRNWSLEDAQLSVRSIERPQTATNGKVAPAFVEVSSSRIFLEPTVIGAALKPRTRLLNQHTGFANDDTNDLALSQFVTNGTGILTYLANLVRYGDHATPYSMITAAAGHFVPADMRDDEMLINEWLADDLQAKTGDKIDVSYYAVDSASQLSERTNTFRVRAIVPLTGLYADRTLMPEFPGVAKAESTQDWDTGFPLVYKIREKDEAYWKRYRGTPKAFIS